MRPSPLLGMLGRCPPLSASLVATIAAAQDYIPNHGRTRGAINPAVTQDKFGETMCVSGWTTKIRPPMAYTTRIKLQQIGELGLPGTPHDYHEDHLVPSCAGGHATDPRNL